jgi:predicted nuclease with TOPRIM domain
MADLNRQNSKRNSEFIRQGIVKCLALEAECKALRESLAESEGRVQKLEAQTAEMAEDRQGLMRILGEKDALIGMYSALMSETLDKNLQRERQGLRHVEAKVFSALQQLEEEMGQMGLQQQGPSGSRQLSAKRPGLIRQDVIVPGTSTSGRSRPRISRTTTPRLSRQEAQMYEREEGEESPEGYSLLQMARQMN